MSGFIDTLQSITVVDVENLMAVKRGGLWYCSHCGSTHPSEAKADACRDEHELIYVPFTKTQLNRLIQFLFTGEEALLTPDLMSVLTKYLRGNE